MKEKKQDLLLQQIGFTKGILADLNDEGNGALVIVRNDTIDGRSQYFVSIDKEAKQLVYEYYETKLQKLQRKYEKIMTERERFWNAVFK